MEIKVTDFTIVDKTLVDAPPLIKKILDFMGIKEPIPDLYQYKISVKEPTGYVRIGDSVMDNNTEQFITTERAGDTITMVTFHISPELKEPTELFIISSAFIEGDGN